MWYIKETISNKYVYKCFSYYCITTGNLNQAIVFSKLPEAKKMAEILQNEYDAKWNHHSERCNKKIFKTISVGWHYFIII